MRIDIVDPEGEINLEDTRKAVELFNSAGIVLSLYSLLSTKILPAQIWDYGLESERNLA